MEEMVVEAELSLRLKREAKRRMLERGDERVQNIGQAMEWGEDSGTKEGRGGGIDRG